MPRKPAASHFSVPSCISQVAAVCRNVCGDTRPARLSITARLSVSASTPPSGHPLRGTGANPAGVRRCLGGFAQGIGRGLSVRHDHGSQYMSDAFQQELAFLGVVKLARLRTGSGGQRLCRALHPHAQGEPAVGAHLRHCRGLRQALLDFREIYNTTWLIERHGFQTPRPCDRTSFHPRHGPRSINRCLTDRGRYSCW